MAGPKISIIVSTYNASHLLAYAIRSVLRSDFTDWEMIVVGDHCTDDTEHRVADFADPRIRFTNLSENSGQQAKPSNVGLAQARGDYICYLNQDDMYFPWHLGAMVRLLEATSADIACAGHAVVESAGIHDGIAEIVAAPGPATTRNRYSPLRWYLASTWFMRADAARDVGPWKMEEDIYVAPSQEWMFRAWTMGKRIVCPDEISVLLILSGARKGSYKRRDVSEHRIIYEKLISSDDAAGELARALSQRRVPALRGMKTAARRLYSNTVGRASILLGMHPDTAIRLLRFGGRGGVARHWKRAVQSD